MNREKESCYLYRALIDLIHIKKICIFLILKGETICQISAKDKKKGFARLND